MTEQLISRPPLPLSWVAKIFYRMQGRYGSMWVDKWRTGETGANGVDAGVANAMEVWAEELSGFADKSECIKYSLDVAAGNKFPPSCPEFLELCRECARRKISDALKLEKKITPEEREQQKLMADKIAGAVKKPEEFDHLAWAKKPRSQFALDAIRLEIKNGNRVLVEVVDRLIADGIASRDGKLLKRYDGAMFLNV